MEAGPLPTSRWRARRGSLTTGWAAGGPARGACATVAGGLLLLTGCLLLHGRILGDVQPLGLSVWSFVLGVGVALVAGVARQGPTSLATQKRRLPGWCVPGGLAMWAFALLPESGAGPALTWLVPIATGELLAWQLRPLEHQFDLSAPPRLAFETPAGQRPRVLATDDFADHAGGAAAGVEAEFLAPEITQRITRAVAADGQETVAGCLRVALAAGQRTAYAHVGFTPPLAAVPELEFEQTAGPKARLRLAQAAAHGCRLDVKLVDAPCEATSLVIEFAATACGHVVDEPRTSVS